MRNLYFSFLFLSSSTLFALEIDGEWVSSKVDSMDYNNKYAVLTDEQVKILNETLDNLVLNFDGKQVTRTIPDRVVNIDGKDFPIKGGSVSFPYTVIGSDSNTIVIESFNQNNQAQIIAYNFKGSDKMWLYFPTQNVQFDHLNVRHYFVRAK